MKIPFSPPYIDQDIIDEVTHTLESGWITTGPKVKLLEEETALYSGVEKAVAVNSATSAMMLVLHWMGITRGDEVIVPAYTYCATALAAMHIGATPVMVEIGPDFNIDPQAIKKAITPKTKAIIAVDLGGWPCDYEAIYAVLAANEIQQMFAPTSPQQKQLGRILVMNDAAHSLGARYNHQPVAKAADITVFSLHAVKNVTSAEGGIICLNLPAPFDNNAVYATMKLWSMNGQTKDALAKSTAGGWQYDIVYPGFKMNMPDVLAAIGLAQLRKYIANLHAERKRVVELYHSLFKGKSWAILPAFERVGTVPSYHLYLLRIEGANEQQRNQIINKIAEAAVSVNVHFTPLPMLAIFKEKGYDIANYPIAYQQYANVITLPVYPQLTTDQITYVAQTVIEATESVVD